MKKFTIQSYSTFSAAVLIPALSLNAQAVYVDAEPDIIIDYDINDVTYIDLDGNGVSDFGFYKYSNQGYISSYYGGTYGYYEWQVIRVIVPGENGLHATEHSSSSGTWLVMNVLESGDQISDENLFETHDSVMVSRRREVSSLYAYPLGDWFAEGPWRNIPEFPDRYLGLRFTDETECIHYGWLRCAITEEEGKLTIKGWAFESKCDVAILAGDKIGDTSIIIDIEQELLAEINIYSTGKDIYFENVLEKAMVKIFNNNGQLVQNLDLIPPQNRITLDGFSSGIYIVELETASFNISQKVFIE
jgi:hypothetical protein